VTPRPYYERGGITIYHGDCREILPSIKADVVVTDPPYGLGIDGAKATITNGVQVRKAYDFLGWDSKIPDEECLRAAFGAAQNLACFGGNYFSHVLPPSRGWMVWDKAQRGLSMSDCELIYTSLSVPSRILTFHRAELWRERPQHPTQKPTALVTEVIQMFEDGLILDPFMGSGTTLRAAKDLGRKAIGIEIEERYCEIAAKRLGQEVLAFEATDRGAA
jgi:site-specific DNA-methyltransferase (adenine-specific)